MKSGFCIIVCALLCLGADVLLAQEVGSIKVSGDVTTFATYDSRECHTAVSGLYNVGPKDVDPNGLDMDLNDAPTVRMSTIATRLGLDWTGFSYKGVSLESKVEGDFCANLNGGAMFRLRHAYAKCDYDIDRLWHVSALFGQTRHPMAKDHPDVLSLSLGAPFNPYNFSPQLTLDARYFKKFGMTFSVLWQMQYASTGPEGVTNAYMNYGSVPEMYAGAYYKGGHFRAELGAEVLSIKPRHKDTYASGDIQIWMQDRITTFSAMAFVECVFGRFAAKGKTVFSQAGEHLGLMGGYAVRDISENYSRLYTPYLTSSSWIECSYAFFDKLKVSLFGGYIQNLGTAQTPYITGWYTYYAYDAWNMNRMWRAVPTVSYTMLKDHLKVGIDFEMTAAQYGDIEEKNYLNGLADQSVHWVRNNRVELVVSCQF